jgi:ribonuclease III
MDAVIDPARPASGAPSAGATMADASTEALRELLDALPEDLLRQVFTHASWSERRSDSYERLAFLGDSVLGLAVSSYLYPRLEADRFGAGRMTKIRGQAVSGAACRAVAERLEIPERLQDAAPQASARDVTAALNTERVLASVLEAAIGACYLNSGYEVTAEAVVEAFKPQIEIALEHPVDFKSTLQELLARRGARAEYEVAREEGPAHRKTFEVIVSADGEPLGSGEGPSKKHAEQRAAREALEHVKGSAGAGDAQT